MVDAEPEYDDARELFDAALTGNGVVVDRYGRPEGAEPGDDVVIDDGRGPLTFRLLGVVDTFVLNAVMFGPDEYGELFRSQGPTFVLGYAGAGHAGGRGSRRVIRRRTLPPAWRPCRWPRRRPTSQRSTGRSPTSSPFSSRWGLPWPSPAWECSWPVRSASAGASLAMLRALGFRRRQVALTLMAEPLLQTLVGAAIGLGVGLSVLWLLFRTGFNDLAFVVDWSRLGVTVGAVLLLVTLVCIGPALFGSRRDPATALHDLG